MGQTCGISAGVETARTTEGGGDGQLLGKAGSLAGNTHRIYLPHAGSLQDKNHKVVMEISSIQGDAAWQGCWEGVVEGAEGG